MSMDRKGYTEHLRTRGWSEETIAGALELVEGFLAFLEETDRSIERPETACEAVHAYSRRMIEAETNTWENYVALLQYGRFIGNDAILIAALELIDGAEALDRLYEKLGEEIGEETRDRVFAGVERPPLGTPNADKVAATAIVMRRLEELLDPETCRGLLKDSLRNLEDEWFLDAKQAYEEAGDIDAYLERKGADFIAELTKHRDDGTLYFSQPVNDTMIANVEAHPEIKSGVREGNRIIEAKIPHQTIKYLAATDSAEKAYHYCHCPWAKESLKNGPSDVSPTFCYCSAGFHKKPCEVIFGQPLQAEVLETVLAGDPWCKFAIVLPDGVT